MPDIEARVVETASELSTDEKPSYYSSAFDLAKQAELLETELNNLQTKLPPSKVRRAVIQKDGAYDLSSAVLEGEPVGFELWEALAYDLALEYASPQVIMDSYNISKSQFDYLQRNPYFRKLCHAKRAEVQKLGSDAAFVVKMRMLATRAMPQFLRRLTDEATSNRDFHALFKTAVELAKLLPSEKEAAANAAVVGAQITFNIRGVPGLDHLAFGGNRDEAVIDGEFVDKSSSSDGLVGANEELVEL